MEMEDILEKTSFIQNKTYRIKFEMGDNKQGIERLYKYNDNSLEPEKSKYKEVEVTDLYGEDRKRKDNIIGTTLVNFLNKADDIKEKLTHAIESIKILNIEKNFEEVEKISSKYNIGKLSKEDLKQYYKKACELIDLKEKEYSDKIIDLLENDSEEFYTTFEPSKNEIIEEILTGKKLTDNNVKNMLLFLKEIYSLTDFYFTDNEIDYLYEIIIKEIPKEELILELYSNEIYRILKHLKGNMKHLLGNYDFIINSFIKNFETDLAHIYIPNNIETLEFHKKYIENNCIRGTTNTYHKHVNKYYNKYGLKQDTIKFMKGMTILFLKSLKNDTTILSLQLQLLDNDIAVSQLPNVTIDYTRVKKYIEETGEYNIGRLKPTTYTYNISSLIELFNVSIYHIVLDNRVMSNCKVCGKYFISETRNTELFCRRIDTKDKKQRPCYIVGKQVNTVAIHDEVKNLYKKLYNRMFNNSKYKTTLLPKFMKAYENYKLKIEKNEHDKKTIQKYLYHWLKKYDEEFKQKFPSDRYDRKNKNRNI